MGLAAAHGLAIGWGVPLAGCSSLALIAAAARGDVAVALLAGHGEMFVQGFAHDPLRPTGDLAACDPAEAARRVTETDVLGSGARAMVTARGSGRAADACPRAADARLLPEGLRSLPVGPPPAPGPDAKPMP